MAGQTGLEPVTYWLTASCSNQLSYCPVFNKMLENMGIQYYHFMTVGSHCSHYVFSIVDNITTIIRANSYLLLVNIITFHFIMWLLWLEKYSVPLHLPTQLLLLCSCFTLRVPQVLILQRNKVILVYKSYALLLFLYQRNIIFNKIFIYFLLIYIYAF